MRLTLMLSLAIALATATAAEAEAPATQPASAATQPSTQPSAGVIRGRVKIGGGLSLQRPDFSRVVIYLASDPALDAPVLFAERPAMSQRDKSFQPGFLVV